MKCAGLGLLSLFLFSSIHVAHSGIFDTLLYTAKNIGAGIQRFGDDVIGAFVNTKDKCPHGDCGPPPMPLQAVHTVQAVHPIHAMQPLQPVDPGHAEQPLSAGGLIPVSYAPNKTSGVEDEE